MESWPVVAWIFLLTNLTNWMKVIQTRDFTMKDIIILHPSTTPHPGGFKCFTCEDAADNYECNRWAPDVYCPKDTRYCYTFHMMDNQGNSVSVTKRCAALDDCQASGCAVVGGYQVCSSCCEGNICNLLVPSNESSAVFSTTSPLVSSSTKLLPAAMTCIISSVITLTHIAKAIICGT